MMSAKECRAAYLRRSAELVDLDKLESLINDSIQNLTNQKIVYSCRHNLEYKAVIALLRDKKFLVHGVDEFTMEITFGF